MELDVTKDLCPCGSGRIIIACCHRGGVWRPPEPLPRFRKKTGYSHPDCYARTTSDCSKNISGEHFISRNVLEIIAPDGTLLVSGFPWQSETPKQIGTGSLKANILCNRHNADLSPLDELAKIFFERIRDIAAEYNGKLPNGRNAILLNGHALERWALKVLCGAAFSGNASISGVRIRGWVPPERWLRTLFDGHAFAPPQGLYFVGENQTASSTPGFGFATIGSADMLVGAAVHISGFRFVLAADPMPVDVPHSDLKSTNHRVFAMKFSNDLKERYILFGWPKDSRGDRGQEIRTNWLPPRSGEAAGEF